MRFQTTSIILAAGRSSRFGSEKGLAKMHGHPCIDIILNKIKQTSWGPIYIVLGHDHEAYRTHVKNMDIEILVNPDPDRGQTSSLQIGLRAIPNEIKAVAYFLVDHPFVTEKTLLDLKTKIQKSPGKVIRPTFQGKGGHPTIFPMSLRDAILELNPTESARSILLDESQRIDFPTQDPGVVQGFNTPQELEAHLRNRVEI